MRSLASEPRGARGFTSFVVNSGSISIRAPSQASLERKFLNFAGPAVGPAKAKRILATVGRLDEVTDVSELTQLLRGAGKQRPA